MKSLVDLCVKFHIKNRPTILNDEYVMKSILMYKYSKNTNLVVWIYYELNTINDEILEFLLYYQYYIVYINEDLISTDVKNILSKKRSIFHLKNQKSFKQCKYGPNKSLWCTSEWFDGINGGCQFLDTLINFTGVLAGMTQEPLFI